MIKSFRRGGGAPSKPSSPFEQLLSLSNSCFEMFLERPLNDPHSPPPHSKHLSLLPSSPSTNPSPPKILIIHHGEFEIATVYEVALGVGCGGNTKKISSSSIIFLGYKNNFQKSWGGTCPPAPSQFLRHSHMAPPHFCVMRFWGHLLCKNVNLMYFVHDVVIESLVVIHYRVHFCT